MLLTRKPEQWPRQDPIPARAQFERMCATIIPHPTGVPYAFRSCASASRYFKLEGGFTAASVDDEADISSGAQLCITVEPF